MSETEFIPYEEAKKIVSDVVEMEHPSEDGKRIFNVYNQRGYAICWFYAEDVENEIEAKELVKSKNISCTSFQNGRFSNSALGCCNFCCTSVPMFSGGQKGGAPEPNILPR